MVVILLAGPNRMVDLILKSLALRLFEVIISDDCGSLFILGVRQRAMEFLTLLFLTGA